MSRLKDSPADYGSTLVNRTVSSQERAFTALMFEKRKPVLSSSLTLAADIADTRRRDSLRPFYPSGVIERFLDRIQDPDTKYSILGTRNSIFATLEDKPDEFMIQGFSALANGEVAEVRGSRVNGASLFSSDWNTIKLNAGPASAGTTRTDLVFLEFWFATISEGSTNKPASDKIWPLGNLDWGEVASYFDDDLIDTTLSPAQPTDGRIQFQYRFRVVDGVDRASFPDPMLHGAVVKAQGAAVAPTAFTYDRLSAQVDSGLYVAGDGNPANGLGTTTGYVMAIPVCLVGRRNTSAYNPISNPNGGSVSIANVATTPSDRPDGVYGDEVTVDDVEDLRHSILAPPDLQRLVEEEVNALLEGLRTDVRSSLTAQSTGRMIQTDSIIDVGAVGVGEIIGEPDDKRTVWVTGETQEATQACVPGTAGTYGPHAEILHIGAQRILRVTLPVSDTIQNVTLHWRRAPSDPSYAITVGAGLLSDSYPTTNQYEAEFDTAHGNWSVTDEVDISYEIVYQDATPVKFSQPIESMLNVVKGDNTSPFSSSEEATWVENSNLYRTGTDPRPRGGGTNPSPTYDDGYDDYNPLHVDYQSASAVPDGFGVLRMEHYYFYTPGVTASINTVPSQINGFDVVGVYRVYDVTAAADVQLISVQKNTPPGFLTLNFAAPVALNHDLRIDLIVEMKGTVWSQSKQGLLRTVQVETLSFVGDGSTEYWIEASERILSLPTFYNPLSSGRAPFVWKDTAGTVSRETGITTFEIVNERLVHVEFTVAPTAANTVEIPVVVEFAPQLASDSFGMVYDYLAAAGLSGLPGFVSDGDEFEVVAEGKPFVHSVGTAAGVEVGNWLIDAPHVFPRGDIAAGDMVGVNLKIENAPYDRRKVAFFPNAPALEMPLTNPARPFQAGQNFIFRNLAVVRQTGYNAELEVALDSGRKFYLPKPNVDPASALSTENAVQYVFPFLIRLLETGEIFLLILTWGRVSDIEDDFFSTELVGTGIEIYTTRDRWLTRV